MTPKTTLLATTLLLSALMAPSPAHAQQQWTQTKGPQGAVVSALAASGSRIYAEINGDIYHYDDASARWLRRGSLGTRAPFYAPMGGERFLVDGNDLVGVTHGGIIRSSDDGVTWIAEDVEGALFVTGGRLHLMSGSSVLRRESGEWRHLGELPEMGGMPVIFGSTAFTVEMYGAGVFRSDDGMRSWRRVQFDFPFEDRETTAGSAVSFASGSEYLYAAVGGAEIFRSRDGSVWENITGSLPNYLGLQTIVAEGNDVVITTGHGTYRHDGERWRRLDIGSVREIVLAGDRALFATWGGVRALADDGVGLTSLDGGMVTGNTYALSSIGDIVLASTSEGLYRTADGGESWQHVSDFTPWSHSAYAVSGRTLFGVAGVLYRSIDSGATWSMSGPEYDFELEGPPYRADITGVAAAGDDVYVGAGSYNSGKGGGSWASGGVCRSSDDGTTWTEISRGLPYDGFTYAPVGDLIATRDYLLVATARGIYRSTDRGARWQRSMGGLSTSDPYIGHGELFAMGDRTMLRLGMALYESIDGGQSWRPMSMPPEQYSWSGYSSSFVDGALYATSSVMIDSTTFEMRLLRFDGTTWEDVTSTQPVGVTFQSIVRAGDHLYAGTLGHGVWRMHSNATSASVDAGIDRTPSLSLSPVPAADAATLHAIIAHGGTARLTISDARGSVVDRIELGELERGRHDLRLDLTRHVPGAYLIQLTVDDVSATTRMVKQ